MHTDHEQQWKHEEYKARYHFAYSWTVECGNHTVVEMHGRANEWPRQRVLTLTYEYTSSMAAWFHAQFTDVSAPHVDEQ